MFDVVIVNQDLIDGTNIELRVGTNQITGSCPNPATITTSFPVYVAEILATGKITYSTNVPAGSCRAIVVGIRDNSTGLYTSLVIGHINNI